MIFGILASVALRKLPPSNVALFTESDRLATHLRYTQLRALSDIYDWRLEFTNATTYQIGPVLDPEGFTPGIIPGTASTSRTLTAGVSLSGQNTLIIQFDPWGRPVDANGTLLTENQTPVLSEGNVTASLLIYAETGFIP